jgi:hypothetical protein
VTDSPDEHGVPEIITEQERHGADWPAFLSLTDIDVPGED